MDQTSIFNDLFVLEMTNNHRGSLDRGLRIVAAFSDIVRKHQVKAAIKLQFRNYDTFIHKDFKKRNDIYYVKRVNETRLNDKEFSILIGAIRHSGCIPLSTPFDDQSVDMCVKFKMPFIKVASSSSNDWTLLEKIASTGKPVIVSVGGAPIEDIDQMVAFFESKKIPMAINHCVCGYPHEDHECSLNQIDFLRERYPGHVIGYSSHEYQDWVTSIAIAYAKGVRTFERHIDIDDDGVTTAKYSSLPRHIDMWFHAHKRTKAMCGPDQHHRTDPLAKETEYLNSYIRGVFAQRDLAAGHIISERDIYLAIPLHKGQISTREFWPNKYDYCLTKKCKKDSPIVIDVVKADNLRDERVRDGIRKRGMTK